MSDTKLDMIITSRERDIGGFKVRRLLPYATHRMVGPFIFFDHMGPAHFASGQGVTVRPHPHINLATVTYLFEGRIQHRDSLGSDIIIEPGAVNWMTAGRGIVHSERTPEPEKSQGSRMNGIQLWVALPEEYEECEPTFEHHPKATLPEFEVDDSKIKLLLGSAFGRRSPVQVHSDLFYLEAFIQKGTRLDFSSPQVNVGRDMAFYVVTGKVQCEGEVLQSTSMAVGKTAEGLVLEAIEDSHVMILGGKPLTTRHIYWNFVSSSKERIEEAKEAWRNGVSAINPRFQPIPNDNDEFIPLPEVPTKGTIM